MALIRPGSLVNSISGAVGGVTFVAGKGAPVVRFRPQKKAVQQSQGPAGMPNARATFQIICRAWQGLTTIQRQTWRNLASQESPTNRVGLQRQTSGFAWFIEYNMLRWPAFPAVTAQVPLYGAEKPPIALTRDAGDPTHIAGEVVGYGPISTGYYVISGAVLYRFANSQRPPKMTLIAAVPNVGGLGPYSLTPEWTQRLPFPQSGQVCWISARAVTDFLWPSTPFYTRFVQP